MYEFEYEEDKLEAFNEVAMTSKEDILRDLGWKIRTIEQGKETEEIKYHSINFRDRYLDLLRRFRDKVEKTRFFNNLEPWWNYYYSIDELGITLYLQYASSVDFDDNKEISCIMVDEEFELLSVKTKMLTVEDYAQLYEVTVGTVRQWIRRGKLRCAVKLGSEWRISELSEVTGRGYRRASYETENPLGAAPEEYPFLKGIKGVFIEQNLKDKNMYRVLVVKPDGKREELFMETKDRERFELYLISSSLFKANSESFGSFG